MGWNNLLTGATLAASSAASGMPVTNLKSDIGSPSVAWQTVAGSVIATLTVTPLSGRELWRLFGIFGTNLTGGATMTVALYNNPATLVWTGAVDGLEPGYGQLVLDAGANQIADYAVITISDAANPDGFLNVPLAYLGPAWKPAIGASYQCTQGQTKSVARFQSRGGQEYQRFLWMQRVFDLAMDAVSEEDLWSELRAALRVAAMGANVLLIPNENSIYLQQEAVFGLLEQTADISFPVKTATRYAWRGRVSERK